MRKKSKSRKIFGYHQILDLYDCDPKAIGNAERCYHYLDAMPGLMGTHKQSEPFVIFKKDIGFSGWVPIVESGVSLYTNIPSRFASVDIYSCKLFDRETLKNLTSGFFRPKKVEEKYYLRGQDYIHPTELLEKRGLL